MEVIKVFDRPAFRRFYTVAGRFVFFEAVDRGLAQLVQQLFAGWQLTPVPPPQREAEIEVRFFADEPGPEIPFEMFEDIIGRNFRQPKEGLGFDGSPVAHMWRSMIWPNNFL